MSYTSNITERVDFNPDAVAVDVDVADADTDTDAIDSYPVR